MQEFKVWIKTQRWIEFAMWIRDGRVTGHLLLVPSLGRITEFLMMIKWFSMISDECLTFATNFWYLFCKSTQDPRSLRSSYFFWLWNMIVNVIVIIVGFYCFQYFHGVLWIFVIFHGCSSGYHWFWLSFRWNSSNFPPMVIDVYRLSIDVHRFRLIQWFPMVDIDFWKFKCSAI